MLKARYDELGREIPDPTPAAIPAGYRFPETLQDQIKRLVRTELSRQADQEGQETFEEANDFEVEEEYDPTSPYELKEAVDESPPDASFKAPRTPLEAISKVPQGGGSQEGSKTPGSDSEGSEAVRPPVTNT